VSIRRPDSKNGLAFLRVGRANGVFTVLGEVDEPSAYRSQAITANRRKSVVRGSMKQHRRRRCDRLESTEFDTVAIRRSNSAVANVETIHPFDNRSERRFIDERPIVTIEPNRDDQILQVRPAFIGEVESESSWIVT